MFQANFNTSSGGQSMRPTPFMATPAVVLRLATFTPLRSETGVQLVLKRVSSMTREYTCSRSSASCRGIPSCGRGGGVNAGLGWTRRACRRNLDTCANRRASGGAEMHREKTRKASRTAASGGISTGTSVDLTTSRRRLDARSALIQR